MLAVAQPKVFMQIYKKTWSLHAVHYGNIAALYLKQGDSTSLEIISERKLVSTTLRCHSVLNRGVIPFEYFTTHVVKLTVYHQVCEAGLFFFSLFFIAKSNNRRFTNILPLGAQLQNQTIVWLKVKIISTRMFQASQSQHCEVHCCSLIYLREFRILMGFSLLLF